MFDHTTYWSSHLNKCLIKLKPVCKSFKSDILKRLSFVIPVNSENSPALLLRTTQRITAVMRTANTAATTIPITDEETIERHVQIQRNTITATTIPITDEETIERHVQIQRNTITATTIPITDEETIERHVQIQRNTTAATTIPITDEETIERHVQIQRNTTAAKRSQSLTKRQ